MRGLVAGEFGEAGGGVGDDGVSGDAGDGTAGGKVFKAASSAVRAGDEDSAEFTGRAVAADEGAAVHDQPAADAGADGDETEVFGTLSGAQAPFGQRGGVGVVDHRDGDR
jgi:hypothetical protein